MRAKNHKQIYKSYFRFSAYLSLCVLIGVSAVFFNRQASQTEVNRIIEKTEEYDKIYVQQMELIHSIDSLYQYTALLNTNLNDALLLNSVSRRKQEILSSLGNMNSGDIKLHWKLMVNYNTFLAVKDSILRVQIEEDLVKEELLKCVENNRNATRKLRMGGIIVNR